MNPTVIIKHTGTITTKTRQLVYTIRYRLHSMDDGKPRKHKMLTLFTSKQLLIKSATKRIQWCKSIDLPPWIGLSAIARASN